MDEHFSFLIFGWRGISYWFCTLFKLLLCYYLLLSVSFRRDVLRCHEVGLIVHERSPGLLCSWFKRILAPSPYTTYSLHGLEPTFPTFLFSRLFTFSTPLPWSSIDCFLCTSSCYWPTFRLARRHSFLVLYIIFIREPFVRHTTWLAIFELLSVACWCLVQVAIFSTLCIANEGISHLS